MSAYHRLFPIHANVTRTKDATGQWWTVELIHGREVIYTHDYPLTESGRRRALTAGHNLVNRDRVGAEERCSFPVDDGSCTFPAKYRDMRCKIHTGLDLDEAHRRIATHYVDASAAWYDGRQNIAIHQQIRHDTDEPVTMSTGTIRSLLKQIDDLEVELHVERTGDCMACRGTGVADSSERRCGWCNGRGYIEPPIVAELRQVRQTLTAIAVVTPTGTPEYRGGEPDHLAAVQAILRNSGLFPEKRALTTGNPF